MKAINLTKSALQVLVLATCVLASACNDHETIGLEVQPVNDKLGVSFTDTTHITAYTVTEDSIRTDKTVYNLLGNYNDPVFGKTAASVYTQIRLSSNNVNFGASPVADSIVLTLAYKGYYGKLRKLNVKVYEILDDIYKDTAYYSSQELNIAAQPLADVSTVPAPSDSVMVEGQKLAPHMRIKLDPALAQRFLNESGAATLTDNTTFLPFFKGLFITSSAVNSEGSVLYFDLLSVLSQVTMYYKNDDNDSLRYNFVINDNCARFNHFAHYAYSNASPHLQQQIAGDTASGDSLLYLQSMAGLKVKLQFPPLSDFFNDGKRVLNKAELIVPVENDPSATLYKVPEKLTLARITENNELTFLIDQFEGESHFRGMYDVENSQYTFTITRHIQNIILGNIKDYGLYLMISGSGINGARTVLRGPGRADKKMTLKLTYTQL